LEEIRGRKAGSHRRQVKAAAVAFDEVCPDYLLLVIVSAFDQNLRADPLD
jgi:hypothetical protein